MAEKIYGFDESKSKVEVPDKATYDADISALESGKVDKTTQSAKDSEQDTSIATAQSTADGKQDPIVAGTGISIGSDGKTINHKNSVSAQTSYLGSATSVPRLKFDAQGHITGVSTATIYPPTTPGTSGQVWVSDGSGAGSWQTLASGKKELYTGTLASLISYSSSKFYVTQDFEIEYVLFTSSIVTFQTVIQIKKGTYKSGNGGSVGTAYISSSSMCKIHYGNNTGLRVMNDTTELTQSTSNDVTASCYRLYV